MRTEHVVSANGTQPRHGNAYNLFILVLTVVSLVVMVLMWLPLSPETHVLLRTYDNLVCFIFLFDFAVAFLRAPSKRSYFIGERGWLDLIGSIPTPAGAEAIGVLRLARLSRLGRITRVLRGQNKEELLHDLLRNRAQYAVLITILGAFLVLAISSLLVLQAESHSPDANITTGGDALWWAVVTITTVGYGDHYPVTWAGRVTAVFVMVMGIGLIGSLASIMASLLVTPTSESDSVSGGEDAELTRKIDALQAELARNSAALVELSRLVARDHDNADSNGIAEIPSAAPTSPTDGA